MRRWFPSILGEKAIEGYDIPVQEKEMVFKCPDCGVDLPDHPDKCPGCGECLLYKAVQRSGPDHAELRDEPTSKESLTILPTEEDPNVMRVNVLCLVGAVIGFAAIFSRWVGSWLVEMNLIDVMNLADEVDGASNYFLAGLIFIIGTIVAVFTPLGGLFQLVGAPWFLVVWADRHEGEVLSSIGPYLGIVSAIIVLASIVNPLGIVLRPSGIGFNSGPFNLRSRLSVFTLEHDYAQD